MLPSLRALAFDSGFAGGVFVACGDLDGSPSSSWGPVAAAALTCEPFG
jgi:hypothetical protein